MSQQEVSPSADTGALAGNTLSGERGHHVAATRARADARGTASRAFPPSKYTLERPTRYSTRSSAAHWADLKEELGDLLLQVLFYAQMAADAGYFAIVDVLGI